MRSLDFLLINHEKELDLRCSIYCVLLEGYDNITVVNCMITSAKLSVPIVTLFIMNNINFLENVKQGFKRTVSWNKYRSEITTRQKVTI